MKILIKNGRIVTAADDSAVEIFIAGETAYGNDSPLYGAMGFVRKSEKKSGLTRKKKQQQQQ